MGPCYGCSVKGLSPCESSTDLQTICVNHRPVFVKRKRLPGWWLSQAMIKAPVSKPDSTDDQRPAPGLTLGTQDSGLTIVLSLSYSERLQGWLPSARL